MKEEVYDKLTGNAKQDMIDTYETNETIDDNGTTTKNIMITNTHTPDTTKKRLKRYGMIMGIKMAYAQSLS